MSNLTERDLAEAELRIAAHIMKHAPDVVVRLTRLVRAYDVAMSLTSRGLTTEIAAARALLSKLGVAVT